MKHVVSLLVNVFRMYRDPETEPLVCRLNFLNLFCTGAICRLFQSCVSTFTGIALILIR